MGWVHIKRRPPNLFQSYTNCVQSWRRPLSTSVLGKPALDVKCLHISKEENRLFFLVATWIEYKTSFTTEQDALNRCLWVNGWSWFLCSTWLTDFSVTVVIFMFVWGMWCGYLASTELNLYLWLNSHTFEYFNMSVWGWMKDEKLTVFGCSKQMLISEGKIMWGKVREVFGQWWW